MKSNLKTIIGSVSRWLLANAILPIVAPILVLLIGDWLFGGIVELSTAIKKLMYEGFYIFSAMTLLFSLIEDFETFQKAIKPLAAMILMLPIVGTCVIFYMTEKNGLDFFANHLTQFFVLWGALVAYAAFIKIKTIIYKLKYNY